MQKYVNIMSKVSPETAARMDGVVDKLGLRSKYELMQLALRLVLKYVDPGGEPKTTEEQEQAQQLRELWGDISHIRHEVARVKPNGGKRIEPSEIIAFYGKECLMLRVAAADGTSTTTINQRDVLECVIMRTMPSELLISLREYKRVRNLPSLFAALVEAIKKVEAEDIDVQNLFSELKDPRTVELGLEHKPARAKSIKKFE